MFTKIHRLAGCLLSAGIALGMANTALSQERGGGDRGAAARSEVTGTFKSADAKAGTITITVSTPGARGEERREPTTNEKTFNLAKDVEVAAGSASVSGRGERGGGGSGSGVNLAGLHKPAKLADLGAGVKVTLYLSRDQKTVEGIVAEGPTVHGTVKAVDAAKSTLTLQTAGRAAAGRDGGVVPGEEHTFSVDKGAEIAVDDGRGSRFSIKEAKLGDIPQGAIVTVRLWVDMKKVQSVFAEGPGHRGTIKAVDPAKRTLTLAVHGGDAAEEYALTVSSDAVIVVDDGKGRPLSVKLGKLGDIPVGAFASVKLSPDQVHIMSLRAQGASLSGHLKSVDADKGTIVISVPKGRDDADEKTLTVAKDVHVIIDGHAAGLADLKAGDNSNVIVRFSLDHQTVQAIFTHQAMGSR